MTTFEKSYFELPVSNKKSQCILDLESGKISISRSRWSIVMQTAICMQCSIFIRLVWKAWKTK